MTNLMTPDEEIEHLNLVEALINQIGLCSRVSSEWNHRRKMQIVHDLEKMQKKIHRRMECMQERLNKAS
jgi:hypothetical protein